MDKELFLFIENNLSDSLVVFFSAASAKSFTGYKLIKDLNINKLFIRDPQRSWYNERINGLSDDIDDLINKISKITSNYEKRNIYFIGGSMGGYAALLCGLKLNVGNILAFSPQMIIDSRMPNMPNSSYIIKYKNIYDLIENTDIKSTNIDVWFGAEDLVDIYQLSQLKNYKQINIFPIKFSPHNVMNYFHKLNFLKPLVCSYIENKKYNFGYVIEQTFFDKNITDIISDAILLYYNKDYKYTIKKLCSLESHFNSSSIYYWLGLCFFKNNNFLLSEKYFKIALDFFPNSDEVYYQLALLYMVNKKNHLAEYSIKKAMDLAPAITATHLNKLGSILMLQNKLKDSLDIQLKALDLATENSEIHYQLGIIYFKLLNFRKSLYHYQESYRINPNKELTKKHILTTKKTYINQVINDFKLLSKYDLINFIENEI